MSVLEEVKALSSSGVKTAVLRIAPNLDGKAIKRIVEEVAKTAPELSFLGVCEEQEKVNVFAHVTAEAQQSGLTANAWLTATLQSTGGRGGGRAASAQGSAPLTSAGVVDQIVSQGNAFVAKQ